MKPELPPLDIKVTRHGLPRLLDVAGPYAPLLGFLLLALVSLSLSRLGLVIWQWPRVSATGEPGWMLLQGLRSDLIIIGWLLAPPTLLLLPMALLRLLTLWMRVASAWLGLSLLMLALMELTTPQFLAEYDVRPNRLWAEYLSYPHEVVGMLLDGYPLATLLVSVTLLVVAYFTLRHFLRYTRHAARWPLWRVLALWPLVVIALFLCIRSSTQHRPANLATFAFCDDPMVNSLVANSAFTVMTALYELKNEAHSSEIYGALPEAEIISRIRAGMNVPPQDFVSDRYPTLHTQQASVQRARPLNLVIVLQESLGARFSGKLGGMGATPKLDALADEGIWFDQLYATGTRSVRGIEAVVAGFPPTPAQSSVKLSKSQHGFATLASVLRRAGYRSEFIYGGESNFDNMRGYFLGNGFHDVIDRKDFKNPAFVGDWGVSDEDLFDKTHERIEALHTKGEPFFVLSFSSSNHTPFQFPEGRIPKQAPVQAEGQLDQAERSDAVRYADYAIGRFFDQARQSDYWRDTVFLVVADHDIRVYGNALVPVDKFHIPGVILGADVKPLELKSTASQIDLAPTLLSLMGVNSQQPFPGRDLTRSLAEFGNPNPPPPRAMMQFNQNFAWMQNNEVTVLTPDDHDADRGGTAHRFHYDPSTHQLSPAPPNEAAARDALAQVLMPAWLYQNERYRLPDTLPAVH